MNTIPLVTLARMVSRQGPQIREQWLCAIAASHARPPADAGAQALRRQAAYFLDEIGAVFGAYPGAGRWAVEDNAVLAAAAREWSAARAGEGLTPTQAAQAVTALQNILAQRLTRELMPSGAETEASLIAVNEVVGGLALATFAAFVDTREALIAQQNLALTELSQPALRLLAHLTGRHGAA